MRTIFKCKVKKTNYQWRFTKVFIKNLNLMFFSCFPFFLLIQKNKAKSLNKKLYSKDNIIMKSCIKTCIKYRGIFVIKRNIAAKKGRMKNLNTKFIICFTLYILHERAMNIRLLLAPKYYGHSWSVQCYELCLHAIIFLYLIQARPRYLRLDFPSSM